MYDPNLSKEELLVLLEKTSLELETIRIENKELKAHQVSPLSKSSLNNGKSFEQLTNALPAGLMELDP